MHEALIDQFIACTRELPSASNLILMSGCERKGVDYIIGIGTNSRFEKQ